MTQYNPSPLRPNQLNYATPSGRMVDLRTIAMRQKAIMFCILGYLALVVLQFVVPPEVRLVLALLAFGVSVTGAVFVFMLALSLYNTATGIILGILTLIPLVGLIVLLVINGKATNILRQHGIQVGLLGAKSDQIPGGPG
jgi:hypothetical protein